jgi:hypothetical protein
VNDELETFYLQRIAEIAAGAERRVAHLTVENSELKMEIAALKLQVEDLTRSARGEVNELSDSH